MTTRVRSILGDVWRSPTVTSWASAGAQSLRLFILLPLILYSFNEVEIAAWLLFSSLLFFGALILGQISILFSRMIALAMGGATDLSPIERKPEGNGSGPNWPLIMRIYSVAGSLNLLLAVASVLIAAGLGLFALENLLQDYARPGKIWLAFGILLLGDFLIQTFRRYSIALRGMNHVAVTNRWDTVFNLVSALAGALALLLGAGIVELAAVVQVVAVLGILRFWFLLHRVAEPRFRRFRGYGWDRQVLAWAWPPFWRSFVQGFASKGSLKISTIVFARYADPTQVAAFLLALRLLEGVNQISQAPLSSHVPRFSRLLAEGQMANLRTGFQRQMRLAEWLLVGGALAVGVLAPYGLTVIKSEIAFLPLPLFGVLAMGFVVTMTIRYTLMMCVIGNHVVAVNRYIAAVLFSIPLALLLIPTYGFYGVIVSAFGPSILLVNWKPLTLGAQLFMDSPREIIKYSVGPMWSVGILVSVLIFFFSAYLK